MTKKKKKRTPEKRKTKQSAREGDLEKNRVTADAVTDRHSAKSMPFCAHAEPDVKTEANTMRKHKQVFPDIRLAQTLVESFDKEQENTKGKGKDQQESPQQATEKNRHVSIAASAVLPASRADDEAKENRGSERKGLTKDEDKEKPRDKAKTQEKETPREKARTQDKGKSETFGRRDLPAAICLNTEK